MKFGAEQDVEESYSKRLIHDITEAESYQLRLMERKKETIEKKPEKTLLKKRPRLVDLIDKEESDSEVFELKRKRK